MMNIVDDADSESFQSFDTRNSAYLNNQESYP
jgi:hypothetical protein